MRLPNARTLAVALVLSALLPAASIAAGRWHALVIGIQNYRHLKDLRTPLADAREVASVLERQYGFEVELLLDPDRAEAMRAIFGLRRSMVEEDGSLLVYYAGHGLLDRETDLGYWQPADAEPDDPGNWISVSEVTATLKAIRARHVMVVSDSCYSGAVLARDSGARLPSGMDREEWLRRMASKRSRTALTSGGQEPVMDGGGGGHSVFAKALLEALRENRGVLDGDGLFDLVKRPVVLNAEQTPEYADVKGAGHEGGDFLFVPRQLQQAKEVLAGPEASGRSDFARRGEEGGLAGKDVVLPSPAAVGTVPAASSSEAGEPRPGDVMREAKTGMELVWVPGGCFQMGSPPDEEGRDEDEGPVHEVCVDGIWLGRHEVTQAQWQRAMGGNPSSFKGEDLPVDSVSWNDVQGFMAKLNADGESGWTWRLPTEAEWEHACRAGGLGPYCGGSDLDAVAWHSGNSGGKTHPVGTRQANGLGLHDMSGNVWEWCSDWHGADYYQQQSGDNPQGPGSGSDRVVRGGSWYYDGGYCRSADRGRFEPAYRNWNIGFRLARGRTVQSR